MKIHRLKTAVVFLLGVSCSVVSASSDAPAEASAPRLRWNGGGGQRFADLSHWNLAAVTKEFGKPTEVFILDKIGQSKIKQWALSIPKDADTAWRYYTKDSYPLVERIIFFRRDAPLMVIQRESDW